jgi:hypothetical protein
VKRVDPEEDQGKDQPAEESDSHGIFSRFRIVNRIS